MAADILNAGGGRAAASLCLLELMIFHDTEIPGAFVIDLERLEDERGFFARAWDVDEFAAQGLSPRLVQANLSFNASAGTLRGMHFQRAPHEEAKVVRCISGALFDAIVDLRPDSPAYKRSMGVELTAENRRALYVPEGCAHGFQTLVDATEIFYLISESYAPESEGGVRWNDPAFEIEWPAALAPIISPRDAAWPDFDG